MKPALLPDPWQDNLSIGVVCRLLSDNEVLIDDGLSLKRVPNYSGVEVASGHTVEYSLRGGILAHVADMPVRARDHSKTTGPKYRKTR